MITLWHSTDELVDYIVANTMLAGRTDLKRRRLVESDASKPREFHRIPTHLKQILYLDAPDLIIEVDDRPVLSIEVSTEAGTGHNAFQRFGRLAAAVERRVPSLYVYPEAVWIHRQKGGGKYDGLNPLVLTAMEMLMRIFGVPALFFAFPSVAPSPPGAGAVGLNAKGLLTDPAFSALGEATHPEMAALFETIDLIITRALVQKATESLLTEPLIQNRRNKMVAKAFPENWETMSPLSACREIDTSLLIEHLRSRYADKDHDFGLLQKREKTIIYQADAVFRGDPYPGALAAIDYLKTGRGLSYEDRHANLVMAWGRVGTEGGLTLVDTKGQTIDSFMEPIRALYADPNRVFLNRTFGQLTKDDISRYYMQVRFGTTFTKRKDIRMYAYFADAILFPDGALWREG